MHIFPVTSSDVEVFQNRSLESMFSVLQVSIVKALLYSAKLTAFGNFIS